MAESEKGRVATLVMGVFCLVLALVILFAAWDAAPLGACVAALVLGVLGVDAFVSVARARRSLLSRIGPLP